MRTFCSFLAMALIAGVGGCASTGQDFAAVASRGAAAAPRMEAAAVDRFLIRTAAVTIAVAEPVQTDGVIRALTQTHGGYVENTFTSEDRMHLTVKVPEPVLESFVEEVAAQGEVLSKSFSSQDVTEEMIDIDARLENLHALRERFRQLLERAESVADLLAIERELSRIQTDIDSIERRREALKNQVEYSRVDITIEQKTVYGPLGYVAKGLYWVIEKLFILR